MQERGKQESVCRFQKGCEKKVSGVMSNKSTSENERKGAEGGGESSDAVQN